MEINANGNLSMEILNSRLICHTILTSPLYVKYAISETYIYIVYIYIERAFGERGGDERAAAPARRPFSRARHRKKRFSGIFGVEKL